MATRVKKLPDVQRLRRARKCDARSVNGRSRGNPVHDLRPGTETLEAPDWALPHGPNWARKPPRIDVKFPILGFLMEGEMTGYDLKRRFQDPIGFFYRVSDGSLYPALTKLERDGLVTMRTLAHGRRARKLYAVTLKGREHFRRMLREPAAPIFVHDEAQVKIYFAHHDPQAALEHLERARRFDRMWTKSLDHLLEEMKQRGENPFRRIVVEVGRAITNLKVELLEKLSAQLAREIGFAAKGAGK